MSSQTSSRRCRLELELDAKIKSLSLTSRQVSSFTFKTWLDFFKSSSWYFSSSWLVAISLVSWLSTRNRQNRIYFRWNIRTSIRDRNESRNTISFFHWNFSSSHAHEESSKKKENDIQFDIRCWRKQEYKQSRLF